MQKINGNGPNRMRELCVRDGRALKTGKRLELGGGQHPTTVVEVLELPFAAAYADWLKRCLT
jgi:hypothetical protein